MASKLGVLDILGSYFGDVEVTKIYLGNTEVIDFDPEPTPTPGELTPVDLDGFDYQMSGDDAIITNYTGNSTDVTVPNV